MSNFQISILLFLQLAFIVAVCHMVGLIAKWMSQPRVVAEMIAGVLMGPSFFGLLFPALQGQLFPKASLTVLYSLGQLGLVLYMFLVGLEFDAKVIRQCLRSAAAISAAGIVVPFILGAVLGRFLVSDKRFFALGVQPWEGMIFLAAAMSITAFPMLARIIYERGLSGRPLGTLALAAGSIDDAVAWCILAIVLASFKQSPSIALLAIGGAVLYAAFVIFVGKPLLIRLSKLVLQRGSLTGPGFSFMLMTLMFCAWLTDTVGIYAIFGAFILGTAVPRGVFADDLTRKLEPLTTKFLLPLFFVYSGLNTQIRAVDTLFLWILVIVVFLTACLGKGVACWLGALISGVGNREAVAIATLMNARGLMELIILNIGLDRGIITPVLFTVMALMAILTTLLASPIFELVYGRQLRASGESAAAQTPSSLAKI